MIEVNVFLLAFLGGVLLLLMAGVFIQAARITELKACISKRSNEISVAVMQMRHWRDTAESFQVDNRRLSAQLHDEQEYRTAFANEVLSVDMHYCGEKVDYRWLEARTGARMARDKRRHSPSPMPTFGDLTFVQAISHGVAMVRVTEDGVKNVPVESYKHMPEPVAEAPLDGAVAEPRRNENNGLAATAAIVGLAAADAYVAPQSGGAEQACASPASYDSSSSSSTVSCD